MTLPESKPISKVTYRLHDAQHVIFSDDARFLVVAAGRRFGKTVLAIYKIIRIVLERPGARVWYICPTYRQAEQNVWSSLFQMIPAPFIKSKNEVRLEIQLFNGSEIALKGADAEAENLRGTSLDYVVLDEFAFMKEDVWPMVIRPMLSDRRGGALFIGTPSGKNHFWKLFCMGQRGEGGYKSYHFKTIDNPYIARSEIAEAKVQSSERQYRQEYEAGFEDFSGAVWPEFEESRHIVEPRVLPEICEEMACIDTAMSGTTAALHAKIDTDGILWIVDEFYEQDKRVSEVCERVIPWGVGDWYIDPASKIKTQNKLGQLYGLYDEYVEYGIMATPAENDVMGGINRVAEYFKLGKIRIFSTCKNLIEELKLYHWAEAREGVGGELKPQPYKSKDHACDCLRYIVMSRPVTPKMTNRVAAFTEEWWDRQEERQNMRTVNELIEEGR